MIIFIFLSHAYTKKKPQSIISARSAFIVSFIFFSRCCCCSTLVIINRSAKSVHSLVICCLNWHFSCIIFKWEQILISTTCSSLKSHAYSSSFPLYCLPLASIPFCLLLAALPLYLLAPHPFPYTPVSISSAMKLLTAIVHYYQKQVPTNSNNCAISIEL